jgi:inner membrane protein
MASLLSHPAAAIGFAPFFRGARFTRSVWLAGAACSLAPDVDALGFRMGIRYEEMLGHRGLTHSLPFAAALAGFLALTLPARAAARRKRGALFLYLFLCAASHGLLDAMTNGGLGIAFFAPFSGRRFFLPWRPIEVSPIGISGFFGRRGLEILQSELRAVWAPSLALAGLGLLAGRLLRERR